MYGGRGLENDPGLQAFRANLEAKQAEDDTPPQDRKGHTLSKSVSGNIVLRDASGQLLAKSDPSNMLIPPGGLFTQERPGSAMRDVSINLPDGMESSRPGSSMSHRMESDIGDAVFMTNRDPELDSFRAAFEAKQAEDDRMDDFEDGPLFEHDQEEKQARLQQMEEIDKKAAMEAAEKSKAAEQEKAELELKLKEEAETKKKAAAELKRQEEEAKKEETKKKKRKKRIEKKEAEEKKKHEQEKQAEELRKRKEEQEKKLQEEKQRKLEEKQKKFKEAETKKKAAAELKR